MDRLTLHSSSEPHSLLKPVHDEKLPGHKIAPKAHKIGASLHLSKSGECLDLKLSAVKEDKKPEGE